MVPMRRKNVSSSVPLQSVDVAPVPSKKKCDTNKTAIGMVPRFVTTLRDFCSGLNISIFGVANNCTRVEKARRMWRNRNRFGNIKLIVCVHTGNLANANAKVNMCFALRASTSIFVRPEVPNRHL